MPVTPSLPEPAAVSANTAPVIVAITGATASILGFSLIKVLLQQGHSVGCIISTKSFQVIHQEMGLALPQGDGQREAVLAAIDLPEADFGHLLAVYSNKATGAAPASGTFLTRGMVIIPCSMTTLGKVAHGIADNLVCRAADVTLKERRPLLIVPRESPFNRIHLENMLKVHDAGATLIPPVMSFYQPDFDSVEGQMNYTLGKVMDHLGLTDHGLYPRWTG